MCGGELEVNQAVTVGVCQSCGSTMTLPKATDEQKANLYNRANHFRRNNEFDKAYGMYESILNQDASEAEAYWGLVLCQYGIEYVEDPATHERVPTCHRAQYAPIFSDANYQAALENADPSAKAVYESEAKRIDQIQKKILEISAKEEPFDVFICYKETNDAGTRTPDSVLAQDLYYQLAHDGFKVFFSRITLEDKLGTSYEPYIFAALNSARVMVVIGTKPDYINSVWVKNEWRRYLALIKKGEKKTLIPAYRDMDAYDLPDEFSHFQAQDMSKLGFMQDLTRGIKKLLADSKPKEGEKEKQPQFQSSPTANSLLERAYICLELGDFGKADDLLEQVLNLEPKNSAAYVGKLMAGLNVRERKALGEGRKVFYSDQNFQLALRFADGTTRQELEGYHQAILDRLDIERKEGIYQAVISTKYFNESHLLDAISKMRSITGYKDADLLANQYQAMAEKLIRERNQSAYDRASQAKSTSKNENDYLQAAGLFRGISGYEDAREQAEECENLAKECVYQESLKLKSEPYVFARLTRATQEFSRIKGYKDAAYQAEECENLARECIYQEGIKLKSKPYTVSGLESAAREFRKIENYQDAKSLAGECDDLIEKLKKRKKRNQLIFAGSVVAVVTSIILLFTVIIPGVKYSNGIKYLEAHQYDAAVQVFSSLGSYKDSDEKTKLSHYELAKQLLAVGKEKEALSQFLEADHYLDSWQIVTKMRVDKMVIYDIAAGPMHTVGLKEDGTVVAVGNSGSGKLDVDKWRDIIAIAAGNSHSVGLKADGTVVAVGRNTEGQLNVGDWQDVIAIAAGWDHTVGLKANGTVVAVGDKRSGKLDVDGWRDIIAIAVGPGFTVGLKADGTVIAVGKNNYGGMDVSNWRDIIAVTAGTYHTVGLKSDGTVVAVGYNGRGQLAVDGWHDIIAVAAGADHTVGLRPDGTVVAVGNNAYGQLAVGAWQDVIAIEAGPGYTLGLKADGTVVVQGTNVYGQFNVLNWDLFP